MLWNLVVSIIFFSFYRIEHSLPKTPASRKFRLHDARKQVSARELLQVNWHSTGNSNRPLLPPTTTMASTAVPDDLAFEMLEKMQADLHIEMDRAKAAEAELDKLKKLLAAAQKQLDDPEMVATQVAIDAAGQDGDPFDHCNVCGIDRGDHDCVEGEEPGTCYLVPCEEHLIPVEGAGVVDGAGAAEGAGAVEVSVQTDELAAEDPIAKDLTIAELQKQVAVLQKQVAVLQKELVSENPVPACHECEVMITKLLVEADGKDEMNAIIEKMKAEFFSLTACDDDGTPRWELMGFQRKCWNCDAAYMQKETWEDEIEMYLEDSTDYNDIEAIYKENHLNKDDWAEPNAKNGNCLCVNCCEDITDGDVMECQKCGHLKNSDDVEYVPEFPNSQDDELERYRDFCSECAEIVRAENPEYDSTSEDDSTSDAE